MLRSDRFDGDPSKPWAIVPGTNHGYRSVPAQRSAVGQACGERVIDRRVHRRATPWSASPVPMHVPLHVTPATLQRPRAIAPGRPLTGRRAARRAAVRAISTEQVDHPLLLGAVVLGIRELR